MANNTMGTCPLGGLWYTCTAQTPTFLGCCTSNPCNGSGCPASDFRSAGMGTGYIPGGNTSEGSYWPNVYCADGTWWTCAAQTPSFQGCCEVNPCGGDGLGCPQAQLHPAAFKPANATLANSSRVDNDTDTDSMSTLSFFRTEPRSTSTRTTTIYHTNSTSYPNPQNASVSNAASNLTQSTHIPGNQLIETTSLATGASFSNAPAAPISTFTAVRISVYTVTETPTPATSSPVPKSTTSTHSPSSTALEDTGAKSSSPTSVTTSADIKPIVLGTSGGVALLFIFALLGCWFRRRNRDRNGKRRNSQERQDISGRPQVYLPWRNRSNSKEIEKTDQPFGGFTSRTAAVPEEEESIRNTHHLSNNKNEDERFSLGYTMLMQQLKSPQTSQESIPPIPNNPNRYTRFPTTWATNTVAHNSPSSQAQARQASASAQPIIKGNHHDSAPSIYPNNHDGVRDSEYNYAQQKWQEIDLKNGSRLNRKPNANEKQTENQIWKNENTIRERNERRPSYQSMSDEEFS